LAASIDHVRCDIFQTGFDIGGGGSFGPKDHPQTKEQADYNLKYLIAVALLDNQVGPAQLEPARVQAADVQALLARVEVRPDEQFTARYPRELCTRISIRTTDQRILVKEQLGYEGGLGNPMSWDRVVEKFHWLSEAFADADLRNRLVAAVKQLDRIPLQRLMDLLAKVQPIAAFATTHPGIQ
jgi:2-methylcitrate dehydratase